jgi:hypothetical protein
VEEKFSEQVFEETLKVINEAANKLEEINKKLGAKHNE